MLHINTIGTIVLAVLTLVELLISFFKTSAPKKDLKKDDSNKLKEKATIFYSPLNKAI